MHTTSEFTCMARVSRVQERDGWGYAQNTTHVHLTLPTSIGTRAKYKHTDNGAVTGRVGDHH